MIFKSRKYTLDSADHTLIAGILNITPDSFSDGGKYFNTEAAVTRAIEIEAQGADIIDIGAYSTRPGHTEISSTAEQERLAPLLYAIKDKIHIPISIDTFNADTADFALSVCAHIINDVGAEISQDMADTIKKHNAGWIIMHNTGEKNNIIDEVNDFFRSCVEKCESYGIDREFICLDCGFGFGKNHNDNYTLLANLDRLNKCGCALMTALSKKRMLGEVTDRAAHLRTEETISANTTAILCGTDILRVHDVSQAVYAARIADEIKKYRIHNDTL